jgi:hypothetical protein
MSEVGFRVSTEKLAIGIQPPGRRNAEAGVLTGILPNSVNNVFSIDFSDCKFETG